MEALARVSDRNSSHRILSSGSRSPFALIVEVIAIFKGSIVIGPLVELVPARVGGSLMATELCKITATVQLLRVS